jgi:hypothetical protein
MESKGKRDSPCKLKMIPFSCFPLDPFLYFSLFSATGKEAEEQRDIMWEDAGCVGVTRPAL